ncbi:MAG: hypothetical protein GF309_05395 [Candidatus Lokiarchaeota archaeon]|nr:hypothetical protein [Candidatus Lokiarchaeota archaeon]
MSKMDFYMVDCMIISSPQIAVAPPVTTPATNIPNLGNQVILEFVQECVVQFTISKFTLI